MVFKLLKYIKNTTIEVLRLSHRIRRDPRLSTHVALTARAFLADKLYYSGNKDSSLEDSVNRVTKEFGSDFKIIYENFPLKLIKEKKKQGFFVVHLTVYGLMISKEIDEIRKNKKILVIIGGEKVPPEVYKLSDLNLSVTSQPHSEVASLSIFLHEYLRGKELTSSFKDSKKEIFPQACGKKVINKQL